MSELTRDEVLAAVQPVDDATVAVGGAHSKVLLHSIHASTCETPIRTLGTLNESLPEDTIPPVAGSIDEIDALNLPPVLSSGA